MTASLRVTGVYGAARPWQPHKWQTLFDDYLAGRAIAPRAGTEVHGDDVASAVRLMLEADSIRVSGETFNVSDICVDNSDILARVKDRMHCPHPLPERADAMAINAMGTCKIEALGWKPGGMNRLDETISALAEDFFAGSSVA